MLEDDFTYVIRKAFKGLGLAPVQAAARAGLPENEVLSFSKGRFSAETARRLAPVLGMNPEALANHDRYHPQPLDLPEIRQLDLPFGGERVNAWLVVTEGAAILFDTGYGPRDCAMVLDAMPDHVFITHEHQDHVGGISTFAARNVRIHGPYIEHTHPMDPGDTVRCGLLTVRSCDLSGHANPSLGFHIDGLAAPVLVTGDALFAGSMGGCATPELYQHALQRLKDILGPLPNETILLPGHGPATTLGEERRGNPFL